MQQANAACLLDWQQAQANLREATGHNDGAGVLALVRAGGGRPGDEWCGFFQRAAQVHCQLPYPAGAGGSYNWFLVNNPRTFYLRGQRGSVGDIQPGHKVGFYNPAKGRISHIGSVRATTRNGFVTDEGNTGTGRNAGVHRLSRGKGEIYAGANWLY
ncbi:MAG: hypothetical protein JWP58_3912 [Hymenobacter sp.]|nr:hypothetical protein [Hymenobacter sp.]